jgi:hypothetical protein
VTVKSGATAPVSGRAGTDERKVHMRAAFFATMAFVTLLAVPQASAQECAEQVLFETGDGTIVVHHNEALFNCCASLDVEVTQDDWEIGVFEWEQFEVGPCFCMCCFSADASVSGLAPGDYSVSVWKVHDNFDGTWTYELVGTWIVGVDGYSAPGVEVSYIPCASTAIPDEPSSWGTIKALYR